LDWCGVKYRVVESSRWGNVGPLLLKTEAAAEFEVRLEILVMADQKYLRMLFEVGKGRD
jgi:hypothetical protein